MTKFIMRIARCACREIPIAVSAPHRGHCEVCGAGFEFHGPAWLYDPDTGEEIPVSPSTPLGERVDPQMG